MIGPKEILVTATIFSPTAVEMIENQITTPTQESVYSILAQLGQPEQNNRIHSIVILGDSNMAGPISMGNILAAEADNFLVYRDAKSGRRTDVILESLYKNENTIEAIKSAEDLIFWAGGNSPQHATDQGGLEKIYRRIKEINPSINLIVFDIQLTGREKIHKGRNKVNETNRVLAEEKLLIDKHIKTNEIGIPLEYLGDKVHLSRKTKQAFAAWTMENLFQLDAPEDFSYSQCFEGTKSKRFIELTEEIKNYKPLFDDLSFVKPHKADFQSTVPYSNRKDKYYFPRHIDPEKDVYPKTSITEEEVQKMLKIFRGKGMTTDSLKSETTKQLQFEEYISRLPLEKRLKVQNLVRKGAEIVQYKDLSDRNCRRTPEHLLKYTETTHYSRTFQDSLGNDYTKHYSRKSSLKTIDNIGVLYDMAIVCVEMEDVFEGKYDAKSLFITMLSVGSVESLLNSGIPKEDHVESLEGRTKDFGMFQLNYHTAEYLKLYNPTFWSQFFSIDKENKKVVFKSNHAEILTFAYMLQLNKLGDEGLPKNGDFKSMSYEVAAWHSKAPYRRKIYARALIGYMKAYYKILQDGWNNEMKSEVLNEEVRQEMKQKYAGKKLPKSALSIMSRFVVDNQEALNTAYPKQIQDFNDSKKKVPLPTFSEIPATTFVANAKAYRMENDMNPNTDLYVDEHGDINRYLKEGTFHSVGETAYSPFQNRLPIVIKYTNQRLAERNEKDMQLLLCAEKNGEILFLNDRLPFNQLPEEVKIALLQKYKKNMEEIKALFQSDIKHAYEVIFYAYQEAGYRIEVRVGEEDKFREDMILKSTKEIKKEYPYMTDQNYFKNKEQRPRFIVPYDQPVLLKDQDNFLILNDFIKSITELFNIDENETQQRERLEKTFQEIEGQNLLNIGERVSPRIKNIGNKTGKLEWNVINPKNFQNRINQYHAFLREKHQKNDQQYQSQSHQKRV